MKKLYFLILASLFQPCLHSFSPLDRLFNFISNSVDYTARNARLPIFFAPLQQSLLRCNQEEANMMEAITQQTSVEVARADDSRNRAEFMHSLIRQLESHPIMARAAVDALRSLQNTQPQENRLNPSHTHAAPAEIANEFRIGHNHTLFVNLLCGSTIITGCGLTTVGLLALYRNCRR